MKLMEGHKTLKLTDSNPFSYSGKIVECSWNSDENVWVCMEVRIDKSSPNEFNTLKILYGRDRLKST
ncbi:unnamed protein product [Dovyalis caffra]|uniref:mRNA capping enzyme C-terminal domain-containing protein n=1 Tax=Dovyalis caffra TaxID=77055 RepID=A0AAV1SIF7_9ROSI|nr:unnamed protein product [Dovyalis caffra]